MTSVLDDIPDIVNDALGNELRTLTLTYTVKASYDKSTDTYDTETDETYTCRGIIERYQDAYYTDGLVQQHDRKAVILAKSIQHTGDGTSTVPTTAFTLTDPDGTTYEIVDVDRDPAKATYTLQARK